MLDCHRKLLTVTLHFASAFLLEYSNHIRTLICVTKPRVLGVGCWYGDLTKNCVDVGRRVRKTTKKAALRRQRCHRGVGARGTAEGCQ